MRRQAVAALAALALGAASADAGAGATWHYAPNMFEAQRLETMRQDIKDAEMKVGYSGVFRRPVNDATFRRAAGATGAWRAWGEVLEAVRLPDGGELVHVQARPGDVPAIAGGGPWSVLDAHGEFVAADCVANANPDCGKLPPHLEPFVRTPVPVTFAEGRYDAGRETLGWIYARAAAEPTLFVGESLEELANEDPKHFEQTTKMTAVPGKSGLWCSRVPLAFRYFRFTAPVSDVRVESEMPVLPLKARFAASPRLTRMWQTAAHTINLCMRTFLVDGIKRDRLPWSGDFAVSLLSDAATFREQEVIRRTFRALDAAGPDASDVNTLTDYSLWLVICHDLYQREFADAEFLKRSWPSVRRRVEALLARTDADGFLVKPPKFVTEEVRSWRFIDWTLDAHRSDVALNMILYAALESAARLAERPAVGAAEDAARWRERAKALRSAIRAKALDPATHLFRSRFDGAAPVFLRYANIFAAVFGVAEGREEYEAIGAALEGRTLAAVGTPYVSCFEMLALAKCGRPAGYLACQERIWGGMLDCGATSFWEAWDDRKKDSVAKYEFYRRPFGLSLCHAWGAGPAFLLPRLLVGLEPLEDGYARFAVRPLKEAAGAVYELTLPAGTLKVEVDARGAAKVSLNGRLLAPAADGAYELSHSQNDGAAKAAPFVRPKTTRRYLHPVLSERVAVYFREGKITLGENIHSDDWQSTYYCDGKQPAHGVWLVHGDDDRSFDFRQAALSRDPEGIPVHGQTWREGDLEATLTACSPFGRLSTVHARLELVNRGSAPLGEKVGFMLRAAPGTKLVFGAPDIYEFYAPVVDSWRRLPSTFAAGADGVLRQGDRFVAFDAASEWDAKRGVARFLVALAPGERRTRGTWASASTRRTRGSSPGARTHPAPAAFSTCSSTRGWPAIRFRRTRATGLTTGADVRHG